MGNWSITIQGVGYHHNKAEQQDANRMARRFVRALRKAGHTVERADFTFGAKENLTDENQAHEDDRDE